MRKLTLMSLLIFVALLLSLPASAGSRRYANDLMDDWEDHAYSLGYDVFYSDVDLIDEDHTISYFFDVEPGWYYFVAEGGEDLEDIDMYVYDEDGYELESDELSDNYPICEVEIRYRQEIEVEIAAYSFYGRAYEDYFCLVAASMPLDDDDYTDSYGEVDDIMDYWIDWAEDSDYEVLYSNMGTLERDYSNYYGFDFDRGTYHVYVESLYEDDDIDLYVYDEYYDELDSDTLDDNYPICTFELRYPEYVEIEVAPYEYSYGNETDFAIIIAAEGEGDILSDLDTYDDGEYDLTINDDSDWDYINEMMGAYMELVEDENYEMIYDEIDILDWNDIKTVTLTVGRGDYIVYAEAGLRIEDLDLYVYDEYGDIVAEDTLVNEYPMVEFSTRHSATFEIDIEPYSMFDNWDEGYYLLVVVRR